MSTSQEELIVRMGMDLSPIEKKLRESDRIIQQFGNKVGSALYQGPMGGSLPQSWASMGNLSKATQDLIGGKGGGIAGMLGPLAEKLGPLATRLGLIGIAVKAAILPFKILYTSMRDVWQLAKEGEHLGVSSMFMLQLSKAAKKAGEDIGEATGKLQKFSAVIGQAQAGEKASLEALQKLGVSPWGKSMETVIGEAAKAFAEIEDPTKRAALAVEIFGRGGQSTVEVLEKLSAAQKQAKHGILEQRDLDTLANGWEKIRHWIGGAKTDLGDYAKVWAATMLRLPLINKLFGPAPERTPPVIEAPGLSEEDRKKAVEAEKDLARAREEYNKALNETKDQGLLEVRLRTHLNDLARKLQTIEGETAEKYKIKKEMAEDLNKLQEIAEKKAHDAAELEKKKADYAKQYAELTAQQAQAQQALNNARSDRSGWSVDEILNADPRKQLAAFRYMTGRNPTQEEWMNYQQAFRASAAARDMGIGAKALRLFGNKDVDATGLELFARGLNGALSSTERNPLASLIEQQAKISVEVAEFVTKARSEGLRLIPIMGK